MATVSTMTIYTSSWGVFAKERSLILCNNVQEIGELDWDSVRESNMPTERAATILEVVRDISKSSIEEYKNGELEFSELIYNEEVYDKLCINPDRLEDPDEEVKELFIQKITDEEASDEEILEVALQIEYYEVLSKGKSYEIPDIYQWYLTPFSEKEVEWLCKNYSSLYFVYSDALDLWVLCVTHYGTSWSLVPMYTTSPSAVSKEVCRVYKTPESNEFLAIED